MNTINSAIINLPGSGSPSARLHAKSIKKIAAGLCFSVNMVFVLYYLITLYESIYTR